MMDKKGMECKFNTVGELRKALDGVNDDKVLMCQVAAEDGTAWNLRGSFFTQENMVAVLTFRHPELKTLGFLKIVENNIVDHTRQIKHLRENCPSFCKFEQDVIQIVIDQLTAVNLFAEAEKRAIKNHAMGSLIDNASAYNVFSKIQDINKNLMEKIREMEKQ